MTSLCHGETSTVGWVEAGGVGAGRWDGAGGVRQVKWEADWVGWKQVG